MADAPGAMPSSEGEGSGLGGAAVMGQGQTYELDAAGATSDEDWGRLPPRVAQQLIEAQRQNTSAEYRRQVELYYRIIAERARQREDDRQENPSP